ncbi:5-formyltetrahydrofolate cyclo-ligase [Elsinoe australis]|uniref:5-formyltetrahydrofolate cyclo-ligase n=1 Tax=Elsinoe australis TaxID=40998 RepID=A0A2P7Z1S0_9PEZI|nr:5-formyltetrahydrofolate cyclo-ligase [Elsinoe australis]
MASMQIPSGDDYHSKKAWRKAFGQALSQLPDHHIAAQSAKATDKLKRLEVYRNARSISVFLSMPKGELQTSDIVRHALNSGKNVFVPYIRSKPASMDMLQLQNEEDFESLQPDKWGIPSLDSSSVKQRLNCLGHQGLDNQNGPEDAGEGGLDIILVPCVAFDEDFNRLGHGKGYYDRFLTRYFGSKDKDGNAYRKPYLIGLALQEQLLKGPDRLPMEDWDHKVDALLLSDHFLSRSSSSHAS